MSSESNALAVNKQSNMPFRQSPQHMLGPTDSTNKGPQLTRVPNKEAALIRHLNKLEDNHRARVKILNSIEDRRLNNTLRQMDFAKVTVGHSIEKQARSVARSLATIQQRQKQIATETYHLDEDRMRGKPHPLYDDDLLDGKNNPPSKPLRTAELPPLIGAFSYKDRRREPMGRWIRYPDSFRQGGRYNKGGTSGRFDRGSSNLTGSSFHSARFSSRYTTRE